MVYEITSVLYYLDKVFHISLSQADGGGPIYSFGRHLVIHGFRPVFSVPEELIINKIKFHLIGYK